jgi:NAD(P)H-dependent FMN reductase
MTTSPQWTTAQVDPALSAAAAALRRNWWAWEPRVDLGKGQGHIHGFLVVDMMKGWTVIHNLKHVEHNRLARKPKESERKNCAKAKVP